MNKVLNVVEISDKLHKLTPWRHSVDGRIKDIQDQREADYEHICANNNEIGDLEGAVSDHTVEIAILKKEIAYLKGQICSLKRN
jgi:hypothetical protein